MTRTVEGPVVRHTYGEVHERARLCALALRRLGVREGDRVATIAWNTCRHLESWSVLSHIIAIPPRYAVCHTLNPCLVLVDLEHIVIFAEQMSMMLNLASYSACSRFMEYVQVWHIGTGCCMPHPESSSFHGRPRIHRQPCRRQHFGA